MILFLPCLLEDFTSSWSANGLKYTMVRTLKLVLVYTVYLSIYVEYVQSSTGTPLLKCPQFLILVLVVCPGFCLVYS